MVRTRVRTHEYVPWNVHVFVRTLHIHSYHGTIMVRTIGSTIPWYGTLPLVLEYHGTMHDVVHVYTGTMVRTLPW